MQFIINFLDTAWNYLLSFFRALGNALALVGNSVDLSNHFVDYLPMVLSSAVFAFLGVFILRFLLGK